MELSLKTGLYSLSQLSSGINENLIDFLLHIYNLSDVLCGLSHWLDLCSFAFMELRRVSH